MIVGELIDLLESLPEDTVVLIDHCHVQYVTTEAAGPKPKIHRQKCEGGCDNGTVTTWEPVEVPATVMLGSTIYKRTDTDPEPPVRLYGRGWPSEVKALDIMRIGHRG